MLKIRLRRMGSKHDPCYRVVVSEASMRPTGRFIEVLGQYDPGVDPTLVKLDVAKAEEWIRRGAHPSPTVKRLLVRARNQAAEAAAPAAD